MRLDLRDRRLHSDLAVGAAVVLLAASAALAARAAAPPPRRAPAVRPAPPVAIQPFVPRTDLKVRALPIPTPLLASYRSLRLRLPVSAKAVTIIAFHQAGSQPSAVDLRSLVPIVKSSTLTKRPAASQVESEPDESAEIAGAEDELTEDDARSVYGGRVLRLWRSGRNGEPDTAVDCGAKAGTQVVAPVTGTIAAVHRYKLYGQYDDYDIHIVPQDGSQHVDCCMLHLTDPSVKVGETVIAGVTPIARVRNLAKWFDSQLDEYTHDGGNHVHIQLDRLPRSGAVQLMGGVEAEFGTPKRSVRTPAPAPSALPAD